MFFITVLSSSLHFIQVSTQHSIPLKTGLLNSENLLLKININYMHKHHTINYANEWIERYDFSLEDIVQNNTYILKIIEKIVHVIEANIEIKNEN